MTRNALNSGAGKSRSLPGWLTVVLVVLGLTLLFFFDDLLLLILSRELRLFQIARVWYWLAGLVLFALNLLLAWAVYRVFRKRPVTGKEGMIGRTGEVLNDFEDEGQIKIKGEIWTALTDTPLKKGDRVMVVATKGLHLIVRRVRE
ncbi:MAG TPA: hypothetical protein ENJ23_03945 [Bacteroidetes bacterium]|nr:hypothetical protein [Bacteroidota bacterium]